MCAPGFRHVARCPAGVQGISSSQVAPAARWIWSGDDKQQGWKVSILSVSDVCVCLCACVCMCVCACMCVHVEGEGRYLRRRVNIRHCFVSIWVWKGLWKLKKEHLKLKIWIFSVFITSLLVFYMWLVEVRGLWQGWVGCDERGGVGGVCDSGAGRVAVLQGRWLCVHVVCGSFW